MPVVHNKFKVKIKVVIYKAIKEMQKVQNRNIHKINFKKKAKEEILINHKNQHKIIIMINKVAREA